MIISTETLPTQFEVIDVIFVLHGQEAGGFFGSGGIDIDAAMETTKKSLAEKAKSLGADAVIGVDFEQRIAVSMGMTNKQVLEIFAYGTAVKIQR